MANIKITELNGILKKANDDVLAIVDVSANETKKIAVEDLLDKNVELIAVTDTEPAECSYGDKYYNTEDNLIYTAIANDTWGEDGEEPIEGIFYVVFGEQSSYAYNGTTLISVGGGTEDIIISDTQPTSDDWKLWIDSDKQTDNTYYNDNGTPTNIKTTTFDTLPVGTEVDYDGTTVPSGWTEVDEVETGTIAITNTTQFSGNIEYVKYGNVVVVRIYSVLKQTVSGSWNSLTIATLPDNLKPVIDVTNAVVRDSQSTIFRYVIRTNGKIDLIDAGRGNLTASNEGIVGTLTYITAE